MAQRGAGGFSSHDTIPTSPGDSAAATKPTPTPAGILSQLYVANTTEIQLSKLAVKQASTPALKRVAAKLAADHAKNRDEERALAQKLNVTLTPAAGGDVSAADSAAMPADLEGKTGPDFDRAFVEHEIQDHEASIVKIQNQLLPATQNAEVKAYLQKTLTAMQEHLASLKLAQQQLSR